MERQVSAIVKSGHFHISIIGCIRSFITKTACKTLVNSLVTSRLDNGNILLNGINKTMMNRLQKVQNTATHLITRTRKHEHIIRYLLIYIGYPSNTEIQYKILTYVYCALNGIGPAYIRELVQFTIKNRSLRSSSTKQLTVPKVRTKTYGERQFDWAAASLWNNLPNSLRQCKSLECFKSQVKTHFYRIAF
ncbi:unnamed protein product [Mytilus coruscus]|uniref:Uncharacterized protein n=1 Tax=Mytilus coruscus TaxID=42192 RepID=A0A6J8DNW4_MYTCO|nr:unnamed protein product [Mytilus coruscus]